MAPSSKSTRRWLLSLASAGALVPGCAQEHDFGEDEDDVDEGPSDAAVGVVVLPDGGRIVPYDAGLVVGTVVYPDSGWMGTIVRPDGGWAGTILRPDAGPTNVTDAGPNALHDGSWPGIIVGTVAHPDAGSEAGCKAAAPSPPILNGIVVAPPDASCVPYFPGVMPRAGSNGG